MGSTDQPEQRSKDDVEVVIVGGGVSGALTAYHLLQQSSDIRVIVVDPSQRLGLGLAYSTPTRRHLLNVPAGKMSVLPDRPDHFLDWLRVNHDPDATAETFAARVAFGQYVRSLIEPLQTAGRLVHVAARAVDCRVGDHGAVLTLDNGQTLAAARVVLATGNFDPAPLHGIDPAAAADSSYCHNAWTAGTYLHLDSAAAVTLIGTGLTAVDVLLRLREQGHRGVITAVSRHGVFPNRHEPHPALPGPAIGPDTTHTCRAYLRALRAVIEAGASWRSAVDSLRETTNDLWQALPLKEQRRFHRHLQRRWDVVRHRMAPPVADVLDAELRDGTLVVHRGHVAAVTASGGGSIVTLIHRGGETRLVASRVINCTGPAMNYRRVGSSLLDSLFARGCISAGPHGGGLRCNAEGAVLDAEGNASPVLFNVGPGRLGTLLESIAVPELREQAARLAMTLVPRRPRAPLPVA